MFFLKAYYCVFLPRNFSITFEFVIRYTVMATGTADSSGRGLRPAEQAEQKTFMRFALNRTEAIFIVMKSGFGIKSR
jgi:hypothetical protein